MRGVILYGPPAAGKDTITRALRELDTRYTRVPIAAVRVREDPATRNLVLTIDAEVPPPAPGTQLLPADG